MSLNTTAVIGECNPGIFGVAFIDSERDANDIFFDEYTGKYTHPLQAYEACLQMREKNEWDFEHGPIFHPLLRQKIRSMNGQLTWP